MPTQHAPTYWREKADKARLMAEATEASSSRNILKQLADDYERLADSIERYKKAEAAALARKRL